MGHDDGVLLLGLGLGFAQPVAVALAVAEFQRIGLALGQFDALVLGLVEQQFQAAGDGQPHVIAAMGAHAQCCFQLAVEDHLAALAAFIPEVVRHLGAADQRLQLRTNEIGEPAHLPLLACRTPVASSRTRLSTASASPGLARSAASRCPNTRSTRADPTTAASATLATAAAWAAVRMPKPTATGSAVWRFRRMTALDTSASAADRGPVIPAIET